MDRSSGIGGRSAPQRMYQICSPAGRSSFPVNARMQSAHAVRPIFGEILAECAASSCGGAQQRACWKDEGDHRRRGSESGCQLLCAQSPHPGGTVRTSGRTYATVLRIAALLSGKRGYKRTAAQIQQRPPSARALTATIHESANAGPDQANI